jgi:hypothetical protein
LTEEKGGLKRREWYGSLHADPCSFGRVVAVYIQRRVNGKIKWIKIGEYCLRCGEFALFNEWEGGELARRK